MSLQQSYNIRMSTGKPITKWNNDHNVKANAIRKSQGDQNNFFQEYLERFTYNCFLLLFWEAICVFLIYSNVVYRKDIICVHVYCQKYVSSSFLHKSVVRDLLNIYNGAFL